MQESIMPEEQKISSRKYLGFLNKALLFLLLFTTFFFLILRIDTELKIKEVVLISSGGEVLPVKGVEAYIGKRTLTIKNKEVLTHLSKANVGLNIDSIEIDYPSKIYVYFTNTNRIAWLEVDTGFYQLNENGKIINKSKEREVDNLPTIKYFRPISYFYAQVGDDIGFKDVLNSVKLINMITFVENANTIVFIDSKGDFKFQTESGNFFFSSNKDLTLQAYQLEEALKYLAREGKNFDILDFRFEKTVVGL